MSFEFDDDIDWETAIQQSDAMLNVSNFSDMNNSNNSINSAPPGFGRRRNNNMNNNNMDAPPNFGVRRNRRRNLNNSSDSYNQNNCVSNNTNYNNHTAHKMNNSYNNYNQSNQNTPININITNNLNISNISAISNKSNNTYSNPNSTRKNNHNRSNNSYCNPYNTPNNNLSYKAGNNYNNRNNANNAYNKSYNNFNTKQNTNHNKQNSHNFTANHNTNNTIHNNTFPLHTNTNNHNNNTNHTFTSPPNTNYKHYKTPPPKKNISSLQQQRQHQLAQFMHSAPFSEDMESEPLPDKDLVHRAMKKFNHQRQRFKVPLMDEEASKMWVYPSNLQIRKYQFEAVKQSLFTNELVCFPTGMGKTLIAAVVMYNFYRWYRHGIVVFACPTRALVEQQMKACYDFLDVPQRDYADLTGQTAPLKRKKLWTQARFYFVSPQTLKSDLQRSTVPVDKFVCIVIDEAHKAQGEHSYHTMVRDLMCKNPHIRLLALTATPGNNQEDIQTLLDNLRLSRMVIKYDDDPDIKKYRFETKLECVSCGLTPPLKQLKAQLTKWIAKELDQLFRFEAIRGFQADSITFWNVCMESGLFSRERSHKYDERTKWICIARFECLQKLVMLRERMEVYSIQVMLKKVEEIRVKVNDKPQGHRVIAKKLRENDFNEWLLLCKEEVMTGQLHPKLKALGRILCDHFANCKYPNSRVIVFSSLRYSVVDIVESLQQFDHCKPYHFVGQASGKSGKGLNNKQQQQVIYDFKSGKYNILVSTCVGEEGLDIGQVDIVVHYDVCTNVLRNIQRSGRTGRKREGRVVYLYSTSAEISRYKKMKSTKSTIRKIDQSRYNFFANPPRMFPTGYNPALIRMRLEPPAVFLGLSARKRRKKRTNSKALYQPNAGLLTLTQTVAFQNKFVLDENLPNRMDEIIADAVEHCAHIQSEFNVGDFDDSVRPSDTTTLMVGVLRTIEDEEELSMEYLRLFPKQRREDIMDYLPDHCVGYNESDEFEPCLVSNKKRKIREAQPLFSDYSDDGYGGTASVTVTPRRGRKRSGIYIVQQDDELDSGFSSLMDTDSDDCKVLGTEKKKRKKRSPRSSGGVKAKRRRRKKKSLGDLGLDLEQELDSEDAVCDMRGKQKRVVKKKRSKKKHSKKKQVGGLGEKVKKKKKKSKKKDKKKKGKKKKKKKKRDRNKSGKSDASETEMLDLSKLYDDETKTNKNSGNKRSKKAKESQNWIGIESMVGDDMNDADVEKECDETDKVMNDNNKNDIDGNTEMKDDDEGDIEILNNEAINEINEINDMNDMEYNDNNMNYDDNNDIGMGEYEGEKKECEKEEIENPFRFDEDVENESVRDEAISFCTRGGDIIADNKQIDNIYSQNADDSVLFECQVQNDKNKQMNDEYNQLELDETGFIDDDQLLAINTQYNQDYNNDDVKNSNKDNNNGIPDDQFVDEDYHNADTNNIDKNELGLIDDAQVFDIDMEHNKSDTKSDDNCKPIKTKLLCPHIDHNPWDILNKNEKKTIEEFFDFMMPAPRMKRFINTTQLIKFIKIKKSQMNSFRAMQQYWSFGATLTNKLKNVFAQIDKNNAALDKYTEQCRNIIHDNYQYVEPKQPAPPQYESNANNIVNTAHSRHNDKTEMDDSDNDQSLQRESQNNKNNSLELKMESVQNQLSNYNIAATDNNDKNINKHYNSDHDNSESNLSDSSIDAIQEKQCIKVIKPTTTQHKIDKIHSQKLLKCPLCGSLFDTPQAVGVHIDNDHKQNNAPSPHKPAQTQPLRTDTPILHQRRRRPKRRLLSSWQSPPTTIKPHKKRKKRKLSDTSTDTNDDDTADINIARPKKRRKMNVLSDEKKQKDDNELNETDSKVSQIHAEDYGMIEAVHSDDNISSGQENDDEIENNYDFEDSFINNQTDSPLKTQQLLAYKKALKTPQNCKNNINRLFGKNVKHWMSQIRKSEAVACEESLIDEDHEFVGMEQYEDSDDPILPAWDAEKEGNCNQYTNEDSLSDDDECNIGQRMRRPYLQQTQQLMAASNNGTNRKRKFSDMTNSINIISPLTASAAKHRKLKRKSKESPFFTQRANVSVPNVSPIINKNIVDDLDFLNEHHNIFTNSSFCPEPEPETETAVKRKLFKFDEDESQSQDENSDDEEEIPQRLLHLENITWDNLVTRERDKTDDFEQLNMSTDDISTPVLTPKPYSQMVNSSGLRNGSKNEEIYIVMDATENMRVGKVNEFLRNKYKIRPIIRSLDFVQYVIGDSIAVIRRKESDMIKGEQISTLKAVLHRATDRYRQIIFILHRFDTNANGGQTKHRSMGIGAAKKLDRNIQQISLSPRITLIECIAAEQVTETIVYYLNVASKTNKNNVIGVPLCPEIEDINEKKLQYLSCLPQIGFCEAVWLLREFNFSISNIINSTAKQLAKAVPSLTFNDRHIFIKTLMTHKWQKNEQNENKYQSYMELSSAVKLKQNMQRNQKKDNDNERDNNSASNPYL